MKKRLLSLFLTMTMALGLLPVSVLAADEYTQADIINGTWLTWDVIELNNDAQTAVIGDLDLVDTDVAPSDSDYYGMCANVSWTSSNEDVIATDGTVTRPAYHNDDDTVILTATITKGDYWGESYMNFPTTVGDDMPADYTGTKTFEVTVLAETEPPEHTDQELVDGALALFTLDGVTMRDSGEPADLMNLTYHINNIPYNENYIDELEGYLEEYAKIEYTWTSTGGALGEGYSLSNVTRTDADQEGTIVLTLTLKNATATRSWDYKVPAFTTAEADVETAAMNDVAATLDFDAIKLDNTGDKVTGNLYAVQNAEYDGDTIAFDDGKTFHELGANITWTSSEPSIISATPKMDMTTYDYVLEVTQPEVDTEVTLMATLKSPRFPDLVTPVTKEITVTVAGRSDDTTTPTPAEPVNVTFSYAKESAFVVAPAELEVTGDLSERYGLTTDETVTDPTVLDAIVAAHIVKYGDAFTKATAENYVDGTLSKIFGDFGLGGHMINGGYSSDYASAAVIEDGDIVDTYLYCADWNDAYVVFRKDGTVVRNLMVQAGVDTTLTVFGGDSVTAVDGLDVGTMTDGVFTKLAQTDTESTVTVSFDEAGTYLLTSNGTATVSGTDWNGDPSVTENNSIVPAWCVVTVTEAPVAPDYAEILATMEGAYQGALTQSWENVALKDVTFSDEDMETAIDAALASLTAETINVSNAMKAIFTLKAMEYDPANITLEDGTEVNGYDVLNENATATSIYLAPYVLLALGEAATDAQKTAHIDFLCGEIVKDSNYNWGVDGAAIAIAAVAPYYDQADVKTAVDTALGKVEAKLATGASAMNTNTDALVILAYAMLGKDPATVVYSDGVDIVTDMLNAKLEGGSGFGWKGNTTINLASTKQGMLALQALKAYAVDATDVNPFDLSDTAVNLLNRADNASEVVYDYAALIDSIELAYADKTIAQAWENIGLKDVVFDDATKDAAALASIEAITAETVNINNVMKAIFTIASLGYDPTDITLKDGTTVNAVEVLHTALSTATPSVYTAPYFVQILELWSGELDTTATLTALKDCLKTGVVNNSNYIWGFDTPAMILFGLAPYYGSDADITTAVDTALEKIETGIAAKENFNNSNTDAMIIMAYAMLGLNPADVVFVDGTTSVVDDFMALRCEDGSGFGMTNTTYNARATYQGLMTLKALYGYITTDSACNPFDLTVTAVNGLNEDDVDGESGSTGGGTTTPTPTPDEDDFEVTFSVVDDDDRTWFTETVTLDEGDTVKDAFDAAFEEHDDYSYEVDGGSYVVSITHPTYGEYGEFADGNNSGWKYKVNGVAPEDIGYNIYEVEEEDEVVFYFVVDYTTDPTPSTGGSSYVKPSTPGETSVETADGATTAKVEMITTTDKTGTAKLEVSEDVVNTAIEEVLKAAQQADKESPEALATVKEITLAVQADEKTKSVETSLTKESVASLNEKVDVVTLETALANIALDGDTIATIAEEATGDVTIKVAKVEIPENISAEVAEKIGENPVYDFAITTGDKNISAFGGTVTITIPYTLKEGEQAQKLAVYYISEDGDATEIPAKYDGENECMVLKTTHFSTFVVVHDESKQLFDDVANNDWFYDAVAYSVENELFNGISDTKFAPMETMTRAMVWTVLARHAGVDTSVGETWYQAGMDWAVKVGISDGTNADEAITREQLVTMIYRYAQATAVETDLSDYADLAQLSDWAKDAMEWAVGEELINGQTENTLVPQSNATRAEVATMMMRYLMAGGN